MKMKLKDGKTKVLTLSYDDGVFQDIRLVEIMGRFGIKGTFNLNSGSYFAEDKVREAPRGRLKRSEAVALFADSGHEVAVHSYTHPFLEKMDRTEIIYEIMEDRRDIESTYGTIARGMAYPYGTYDKKVIEVLESCGIAYSRTVRSTERFAFPENWLELHPTCHHNNPRLMELIKRFVETPSRYGHAEMFYLWGHSYEFDDNNNWEVIERFCEYAGGRDDIWYATNIEIYDYVKAYESLQTSYDKRLVHNPSAIDVWFESRGKVYCVKAAETLRI